MKPHIYKRGDSWFVRCDNHGNRVLYPGRKTITHAWLAAIHHDKWTSNRIELAPLKGAEK